MMINMNIGGTEKALLNMINEMPREQYDITILMLEKYGGFLDSIPKWVHVKYLEEYRENKGILNNPPRETIRTTLKSIKLAKALNLFYLFILSKITKERSALFKYLLKSYPIEPTEYDIAIAYAGPIDFISFFVLEKIKAKKKIQWIHFDITKIGFNIHFASKFYRKFDQISVVSKEAKEKFVKLLPEIEQKTIVFKNIISVNEIKRLATDGEGFNDAFNGIRILTVGRLTKEKGQDLIISVLAKLIKEGYKIKWYLIGEGGRRKEYEKLIQQNNLENDLILMGNKHNPYPFMKQCDIYVQPSRHEGHCITLAEAKCFEIPIISTNFPAAFGHITHNHNGLIVNFEEEQMHNAIKSVILNENLREKIKKNHVSQEKDDKRDFWHAL